MAFDEGFGGTRLARVSRRANGFLTVSGLALFLAISGLSIATPQQATAQSYSFNQIEIEGTQRIEAATILSYLGFGRGEVISAAQLNDAYQRLG